VTLTAQERRAATATVAASRLPNQPNRREILRAHRAATDPRRNLRQSAFPADSDVNEQRRLLRELLSATADVEVTLEITPRVPHVFQAYHPILDEAPAALDRAGQFLSAHLDGAERVT
jgi:hypothetical protein